ncbi:MAG: glycosyltransferase family 39 protein [Planctomycetes bacterium]|nr:glycosyltransferase family 39 protein [Planctomycetota bacterium]
MWKYYLVGWGLAFGAAVLLRRRGFFAGEDRPGLSWRAAVALFLLALAPRLAWVGGSGTEVALDGPRVDEGAISLRRAYHLAHGLGYTEWGTDRPTAHRPPGYPFFLAPWIGLFGVQRGWILCVGAVCLALIAPLAGGIAARIWGHRVGFLAGLLTALNPTHILASGVVLEEHLGTLLMYGAIHEALRDDRARVTGRTFAAGLLIGLGAFVRPQATLLCWTLPAAFRLAAAGTGASPWVAWRKAVVFLLLTLCVEFPWGVRNYVQFGEVIPYTTTVTKGLMMRNRTHDDCVLYMSMQNEIEQYRFGRAAFLSFVKNEPARLLANMGYSFCEMFGIVGPAGNPGWYPTQTAWAVWYNHRTTPPEILADPGWVRAQVYHKGGTLCSVFYSLLLAGWLAGTLPAIRGNLGAPRSAGAVFLLLFVLAWIAANALSHGEERYRFPLEPALGMFAAAAFARLAGARVVEMDRAGG